VALRAQRVPPAAPLRPAQRPACARLRRLSTRGGRRAQGLLAEVEEGAGTDEAHVAQVGALREEAARLKAERDCARADHTALGARFEASKAEAMRLAAAVNTELEAERARGQSCEKRLAAATARQGELEAELARAQVQLNAPKVRRPPRSARGG
jgi:chromosome segregation ATPase